jgi:hypothetical protein
VEAKHYARELKYPKGALVYNGTDEDDFLYCLPNNKEISVCREMAKNNKGDDFLYCLPNNKEKSLVYNGISEA